MNARMNSVLAKAIMACASAGICALPSAALADDEVYLSNGSSPSKLYLLNPTAPSPSVTMLWTFLNNRTYHAIATPPGEDSVVAVDRNDARVVKVSGLSTSPSEAPLCAGISGISADSVVQLGYSPEGVLYGTDRNANKLFQLDLDTCAAVNAYPVSYNGSSVNMEGADLAFDRDGTLFLLNNPNGGDGNLYTVNPVPNGGAYSASLVAGGFSDNMGMAVDADDKLIVANNGALGIFEVTKATGAISSRGLVAGLDIISGDMSNDLGPLMITVIINVHPYSDPNPLNLYSGGTTPVAIFGSLEFDVTQIDIATLRFGDAEVKVVGKSDRALCSYEDTGSFDPLAFDKLGYPDGYTDLVCHFVTADMAELDAGEGITIKVMGELYDGTEFEGFDIVKVVK